MKARDPQVDQRPDGSVVVEAATPQGALDAVADVLGPEAQIQRAARVERGGVGGFFRREVFRVVAAPPDGGTGQPESSPYRETPRPAPVPPVPSAPATTTPGPGSGLPGLREGVDRALQLLSSQVESTETTFGHLLRSELDRRPPEEPARPAASTGPDLDLRDGAPSPIIPPFLAAPPSAAPPLATPPAAAPPASGEEVVRRGEVLRGGGPVPVGPEAGGTTARWLGPPPAPAAAPAPPAPVAAPVAAPTPAPAPVAPVPVPASIPEPVSAAIGRGALLSRLRDLDDAPPVGWSTDRLAHLGLPFVLVRATVGLDPDDDLAWVEALAVAARSVCPGDPPGDPLVVGPRAEEIGRALGLAVTTFPDEPSAAGGVAVALTDDAVSRLWVDRVREDRWLHLVVGGRGWVQLRSRRPAMVSSAAPGELVRLLQICVEDGAAAGYHRVGRELVRLTPLEIALGVRGLLEEG
jgi:hypothetical protein